jgi:hypothetical protein
LDLLLLLLLLVLPIAVIIIVDFRARQRHPATCEQQKQPALKDSETRA